MGVRDSGAPLMKTSDKIKSISDIPKTSNGRPVVLPCFDAYRSSLISPDHVFLGLIQNLIEVLIKSMKTTERASFDMQTTNILRQNGMYNRSTILNSEKGLITTTISEAFAILFVVPVSLKCTQFGNNESERIGLKKYVELAKQLRNLVTEAQENSITGQDNTCLLYTSDAADD